MSISNTVAGSAGTVFGLIIKGVEAEDANLAISDGIGLRLDIPYQGKTSKVGASIEAIKESATDNDSSTSLLLKTSVIMKP